MRLYYKILLVALPLAIIPMVIIAFIAFRSAQTAILIETHEILDTQLGDAVNAATENYDLLRRFSLQNIPSNVEKAQQETAATFSQIKFGQSGHVFAVDSTGVVVSHPNPQLVGVNVANEPWFQELTPNHSDQVLITWPDGRWLTDIEYFEPWGWYVISARAEAELLGPLNQAAQYTFWFAAAMVVVVVGMALVSVRVLVGPIQKLSAAVEQVTHGDFDVSVPVSSSDEIGQLAAAFNTMAQHVKNLVTGLEDQVQARTHRLEIAASLGEQLSALLVLDELLAGVVNQVRDAFGYYHAHIYLLNNTGDRLVVAAGTGEAGAKMKADGHNIPLNAHTSLVARAARSGQIVRSDNVRQTADWLPNPLLPNTFSEIAVPIILEGRVLGVLDVQHNVVSGFDDSDANLLRLLANQAAVAIRNARLFAQVEDALAEVKLAQENYQMQAWSKVRVKPMGGQFHYQHENTQPLADETYLEAKTQATARQHAEIVAGPQPAKTNGHPLNAIVAPIKLQDKSIGTVQIHPLNANQQWTNDDLAVVEAVIDQLAQSAENLRLFDETRERASREQTIREITDKLRATSSLDQLLKVATQEISQQLLATHAEIEIRHQPRQQRSGKNGA
ncbi:MAG: GAF domain-containing protein [Chloroflexi bacterium]|nr:MAG: GAF domain-containing protein [Chloroflexota bacterium]